MRILAACIILLAAATAQAAPDYRAMTLAAIDRQIIPGYTAFRGGAAALNDAAASFCAKPDRDGLAAMRAAFGTAMDSWQKVQVFNLGPAEAFNRGHRIHFWPDKKNAGERHLRRLLKDKNVESLDASRIASASVAVQGLPALEQLLYEGEGELLGGESAFRCRVIAAIAANVARLSAELADEWARPGGFRDVMQRAGEPSNVYADHRQAASRLFNAMIGELDAVAEVKLAYPLGNAPAAQRAQRAESWRSARSLRNIVLNLESVRAMAETMLLPALASEQRADTGKRLVASLDGAIAAAKGIKGPMEKAMETPKGWRELADLKAKVKSAARLLENDIAEALDMQAGFNALDGD